MGEAYVCIFVFMFHYLGTFMLGVIWYTSWALKGIDKHHCGHMGKDFKSQMTVDILHSGQLTRGLAIHHR